LKNKNKKQFKINSFKKKLIKKKDYKKLFNYLLIKIIKKIKRIKKNMKKINLKKKSKNKKKKKKKKSLKIKKYIISIFKI
jgi:hypothetical protein